MNQPDYSQIPSPCFLLEESKLIRNLELMKYVQEKAGINIILALKGFSMFSVFPIVSQYLKGTTSSSLHEAMLGYEEFGGETHAYSPAYRDDEFPQYLSICDHISFNSLHQFEKFYPLVKKSGRKIHCGLRINPEYSTVETDLYNPCIPGSRLGTRAEALPAKLPEGISFLHSHNLCESDSYALEKTLENIERLFGTYLPHLELLNLGGGHLMTRKGYEVEHLISVLKSFKSRYPNLKITLEPGSAVAWQTGDLVSTILDIVDAQGIQVLILDTSISAHMPDVIEMPYQPAIQGANSQPQKEDYTYRMGGQTCLAGDYVGDYGFKAPLKIGDKIVFEDMMHYTMVKTTTFNGINLPHIGIWTKEGQYKHVKSFGYHDFKNRLS